MKITSKIYKNQSGFSATELVLAVMMIVVIAVVGGYVLHKRSADQKRSVITKSASAINAKNPASSAAARNPYAGWKVAVLTDEKISYKYPADWTIKDDSTSAGDSVFLLAPNEKFGLTILSGTGSGASNNYAGTPVNSQVISTLGSSYYLNAYAGSAAGGVDYISLVTSAAAGASGLIDKTVHGSAGQDYLSVTTGYADTDPPTKPLATFQKDPNMAVVKLIIQSMHY
jgi:hypothetical protein